MNNNNFFTGENNSNNNLTSIPQMPINNQSLEVTNSTNPQNSSNVQSNSNIIETNNVMQSVVNTTLQQPNINSINNNSVNTKINNHNSDNVQLNTNFVGNNATNQSIIKPTQQFDINQQNYTNSTVQQNTQYINQVQNNIAYINKDELLKSFIGNNYDKITTRPFNFAGFFFSSFYMFYRKMFLYGILLFIINFIILNFIKDSMISFISLFILWCATGLFVNKIYLYYANKKIEKIKLNNNQKDINELKNICAKKGGTSIGQIFLGLFVEIIITLIILIVIIIKGIGGFLEGLTNLDNWSSLFKGVEINTEKNNINKNDKKGNSKNGKFLEDVAVEGFSCWGEDDCQIFIGNYNDDSRETYNFNSNNIELFKSLNDYKEYIKVNIYYEEKDDEKSIIGYELYLKSNNNDITNDIKTEDDLRIKIGLYPTGTHTGSFTLSEIGSTGAGFKDNESFTYTNYVFVDNKNIEHDMEYINSNGSLNLVEGNEYIVTFEVFKDSFDYKYSIKSIK